MLKGMGYRHSSFMKKDLCTGYHTILFLPSSFLSRSFDPFRLSLCFRFGVSFKESSSERYQGNRNTGQNVSK